MTCAPADCTPPTDMPALMNGGISRECLVFTRFQGRDRVVKLFYNREMYIFFGGDTPAHRGEGNPVIWRFFLLGPPFFPQSLQSRPDGLRQPPKNPTFALDPSENPYFWAPP